MQPNIVLINCDDLGYGDLGCYGSTVHDTPELDALATGGARFTDFYVASPVCSPSRAALLTGSYPLRIGFGGKSMSGLPVLFPGMSVGLNPNEITIARLLRDAGYATLAVGKWHCGDQPEFLPTNHGFDDWFGLPYSNDMGVQATAPGIPTPDQLNDLLAKMGVTEKLQFPPLPLMEGSTVAECQPDQTSLTGRYVQRCVDFVQANADRPFFLYLAHMYVHVPIYVEERFREASRNGAYGAAVASIDWATGAIMQELRRRGLEENTLVIFTSDNGALHPGPDGAGSNAPLRAAKGSTWEGGQRVPCIAYWPGHVPAGTVVTEMTSTLDLLPTLATVAQTQAPSDRTIDGHDISALLGVGTGTPPTERSFIFIKDGNIEAIRVGNWKLHVRKQAKAICELYDLHADIGETNNRADEQAELVTALLARLDAARADLGDEATGTVGADTRAIGRVVNPVTLTSFDPDNVVTIAEYDLPYRG